MGSRSRSVDRDILGPAMIAGLAMSLWGGCATEAPPTNVLLVTMDTTRADHLGVYGYDRPTSPQIDRLATESIVFEQASSHVPITLPAHTSIMTGTLPTYHGVRDNGRFVVDEELDTMAELLRDAGYDTAAFVSAFVLDSRFALDQGFSLYDDHYGEDWSEDDLRDARIFIQMVIDRPAVQTTDRAIEWLEQAEPPLFLWVHYYDPHQRYDPPHPYSQLFRDQLYDGEIAFMDSQIGRLWEAFADRGLDQDTLAVLVGDHGESMGEHGEPTHAVVTYQSTLHVPLIVRPTPRSGFELGRVTAPVSQVDILPTVLDLLGMEPPQGIQGRSLRPLLAGREMPERPIYFECLLPYFGYAWQPIFGVRENGWKYIHTSPPEVYDLGSDGDEIYNRAGAEPERQRVLEETLLRIAEGTTRERGSQGSLDSETREKLAALGYTAGAAQSEGPDPRTSYDLPTPRQQMRVLQDYFAVRSLITQGRSAEAVAILEQAILPLDPHNPSFLKTLASLYEKQGDLARALDASRRAQAASPEDPTILTQLASLEMDSGNFERAEQLLEAAISLAPKDVSTLALLGRSAARAGRPELAAERYREVLDLDEENLDALMNLGIQLALLEDTDGARESLERAVALYPLSPRAQYNLALLEYRLGRYEVARQHFERASTYRQPYPEARLGLALTLLAEGRSDRARIELEALADGADAKTAAQARELLEGL